MIPVILFAYARPGHLRRTLDCLRENRVPLICAFSDGAKTPEKEAAVSEVREILRSVDWCEVVLCERDTNLGLGRSVLSGVTEVLGRHEAAIIFEDDHVCVPGTYDYLCAALEHYRDDDRVMSVTGWTHPLVTPGDVIDQPYFDGRAECWVWGTWAGAWRGMDVDAKTLMDQCRRRGIDIYRYGADLVDMAEAELRQNIWAVRLLYLHIFRGKLCLRPPWSMVENIGVDPDATNTRTGSWLENPPLRPCPPVPGEWPEPVEHPACAHLWRQRCGTRPPLTRRLYRSARRMASNVFSDYIP
ncbi:MAG: hypothetical protein QME27_02010 [Syntrophaceae bacterium]|nr:hypothetical protein [Syntrophaceae bacterium]